MQLVHCFIQISVNPLAGQWACSVFLLDPGDHGGTAEPGR